MVGPPGACSTGAMFASPPPRSPPSGLLRPLLRLSALPLVYLASAAYWVVAARVIERRFALGHLGTPRA